MGEYVYRQSEAAVSSHAIENGMCFMCGRSPSTGNGEHVFPLWLQHKYGLLDRTLSLLNGTVIPYRILKTPCCVECNTGPLAKLERDVARFAKEPDIGVQVFRLTVGRWLLKIFLGIVHAECRFKRDRSNPSLGSIFPAEFVNEFYNLHLLVNSCRKRTLFKCLHGNLPFTFYVYRIASSRNFDEFDFSTNIFGKSVALRMGVFGAILVADGGMQYELEKGGPFGLSGMELHPLQFSELAGRVHYKSTLRDATHSYIVSETTELLRLEQSEVVPYSRTILDDGSQRIFRDWDAKAQGAFLQRYTRLNGWYDESDGQNYTLACLPDGSHNRDFSKMDSLLD